MISNAVPGKAFSFGGFLLLHLQDSRDGGRRLHTRLEAALNARFYFFDFVSG
jgi:hypothetical protein